MSSALLQANVLKQTLQVVDLWDANGLGARSRGFTPWKPIGLSAGLKGPPGIPGKRFSMMESVPGDGVVEDVAMGDGAPAL